MNVDELLRDSEYENFVCVYLGLAFVGQILEPYTRHGLQQVHQKIQTVLARKPPCPGTCGDDPSGWCNTCKEWQKELKTFSRRPYLNWSSQESSNWPQSYEHIIGIFCDTPGGTINVNLRDLSNACSIWQGCNEFKISKIFKEKVKKVLAHRAKYFAHNDLLKVNFIQKANAFDALKDLLMDSNVHIRNKHDCLNKLAEIERGNHLANAINGIKKEIENIGKDADTSAKRFRQITESGVENSKVLDEIKENLRMLIERQEHNHIEVRDRLDFMIRILLNMYNILTTLKNTLYNRLKYLVFFVICIVAVIFLARSSPTHSLFSDDDTDLHVIPSNYSVNKLSGCLSESHKDPFPLDIRMLGFLPTQNQLFGRKWVFDILEEKMFEQYTKSRGTLMTAGYGFGKSAIVAHLLCARENENGWKLRQQIVAFHVCKFEHESTKNPVLLIKRLKWFLSIKSKEYRSHIALLENSIVDDYEKCEKDASLCFDHTITNPLDKLTVPNDAPWIVVIDALDECVDDNGRNRILELLADRFIFMQPDGRKWFKWLITSRNMTSLNKLNKLDTVNLLYDDKRNYDDIGHFIINQLNITDTDLVDEIVYKSGGNIVYIKHALEYIIESGNVSIHNIINLPSRIEEIYELNFDRQFKTNNDFEVAKSILQVISVEMCCTAKLLRVIEANKITNETDFVRIMNKLSDYVSIDYYVTFRHNSLYYWLISDTKSRYRISLRLGHVMLSEYLFNVNGSFAPDLSPTIDNDGQIYFSLIFLRLTYHVSESQNSDIQRKYFSFQLSRCNITYNCPRYGINLYENFVSVKMLKLIAKFLMNKSVEYNTFIRFILEVMERRYESRDLVSFIYENVANAKDVLKFPLHKAARHCLKDVAQYFINDAKVSLLERNNNGMRAIDVAAINNCMPVIKLITEKDRSVLDIECLINLGRYNFWRNTSRAIEINKMLVANKVKPTCFDTSLQKEMLMRIYFNRQSKGQFVIYFLTFLTFRPINFVLEILQKEKITYFYHEFSYFYPELLSCSDIEGYTPALQFITAGEHNSFLAVLEKRINDKCQHVSGTMIYIFYLILQNLFKDILDPFGYISPSCPEGASVEHLLMRYKRKEMIDLVIANGYIMNWTKTDRKGMTPLNYTDQMFILQLECRFGVDIQVLSDKDELVRLCLCDWFYFYLLLVLYAIACCIASFIVLYCIL